MDYNDLINQMQDYQRAELLSSERSIIYKIINSETSMYRIASSKIRLRQQSSQEKNEYASLKRLISLRYIEESHEQKKLFGESMIYRFTTYGLLYILSNNLIYPPQLLVNYSTNIILKSLVFQYFETNTIRQSTARFYDTITEYLSECVKLVIDRLTYLKSETEESEIHTKSIEYELDGLVKVLAVKLAISYSESNLLSISSTLAESDNARVTLYELESSMKALIANDHRFMDLLRRTKTEFDEIRGNA
jgi:hypothetical protein